MSRRYVLAVLSTFIAAAPASQALDLTPPQIEGPYYPTQEPTETDADLSRVGGGSLARGTILDLTGSVVDPAGRPISGAAIEIWQADRNGIYMHARDPRTAKRDRNFQFYGVLVTRKTGAFAFRTIMPGRYEGRPPHIHVKVKSPGAKVLTTQLYFKDDPELANDGLAVRLGPALARVTLTPIHPTGAGGPLTARVTLVVERSGQR